MYKRLGYPAMLFIAACIIFSSCGKKSNKEGRYVPAEAAAVVLVNGESISAKLPWEEIKQNELFKKVYADTSLEAYVKNVLDNPENTGIDMKKNLLFFVQRDSTGGYIAFEGTVKDAAKFQDYNNKVIKNAVASEKEGIHFITDKKMTSSWDKEKFVLVIDAPEMSGRNKFSNIYDSAYTPSAPPARNTIATATSIYNLEEKNSLGKDEKFSKLVSDKKDVYFWLNVKSLYEGNAGVAALSMLNLGKLYEGSFYTGSMNFENGRIDVDFTSYAGKELSDIYKKYSGSKLNTEMIKRIPTKDVGFLFAMSFKPEGLKEFIKLLGVEGFINIGAAQAGLTFDDFIKANKGDILLSVSDIKKDSFGGPKVNALFAASVGDKPSFEKLVNAANLLARGKMGSDADKMVSYSLGDQYFSIGTDKATVNKFLNTANNNNFSFIDKASGSPSLFYINIPVIMTGLAGDSKRDSLDEIVYQTSLKTWETIIATSSGYQDGGMSQHLEINLSDKNINSLKQLNQYIGKLGSVQEEKRKRMNAWMDNAQDVEVDSISTK